MDSFGALAQGEAKAARGAADQCDAEVGAQVFGKISLLRPVRQGSHVVGDHAYYPEWTLLRGRLEHDTVAEMQFADQVALLHVRAVGQIYGSAPVTREMYHQ